MIESNINISNSKIENLDDVSNISNNFIFSNWNDVNQIQQNIFIIDNATTQNILKQMIIVFRKFNDKIVQLRIQIRTNQNATQFVIVSQTQSISIVFIVHFKKHKFKKQFFYKNENENEYIRWFREIEFEFLTCFNYFMNNQSKFFWCMLSLRKNFQF